MNKKFELLREAVNTYKVNHCDGNKNEKELLEFIDELEQLTIPVVSNSALIDYIENDAEIAMPIDEFFNEDGTHITKKQYGKVLLKCLVKELREHYC